MIAKVDVTRALCVSTADTGIGIPPDAQRQIFEPFEQEACFDWSEQMEHLGGVLAAALLDHALEARLDVRTPAARDRSGPRDRPSTPANRASLQGRLAHQAVAL